MERLQEETIAHQAKKQNSSNNCHKDLLCIVNNNEKEDNEISEDEDDTACNICEILSKNIPTKKGTWLIYVTYAIIMYARNMCQLTQI